METQIEKVDALIALTEKAHLLSWKRRTTPNWINKYER
jgi:hypothetical protein